MSEPRGVEERLSWMVNNEPGDPGWCAKWTWYACGGNQNPPNPPAWGAANANAVVEKCRAAGVLHTDRDAPRGAIVLWTSSTHGHMALSKGPEHNLDIMSTDPYGKWGTTGTMPQKWPEQNWGQKWAGWSTHYAGVDLPMGEDSSMGNAYDYGFHGAESTLKVGTSYIPLVGASEWNPSRDGLQFGKLYFKVSAVKFKSGKAAGAVRVKCVRENPTDPTWYHDVVVHVDALDESGETVHSFSSFESGENERNLHWEVKCEGGLESCSLATTRYAGWAVIGD